MAAVSIRKRCTDTAPRTKDQGHLHLWLHLKDGFNKKGKMTQNHNFSITRDVGFSQFFFKSYFRSLRSLLVRQLEQQHGRPTWATSLDRSSCVVLTATEGDGLLPMCSGLVERYNRAGEAPPKVLYVDRDCCSATGKGKAAALFAEWDQLAVRLDVWHFMRRFAVGVTTDCHPLYSVFMKNLSACIFEWDASDVERLKEAKRSSGCQPTSKELARHCRRRTRGAQETKQLIEKLLRDFRGRQTPWASSFWTRRGCRRSGVSSSATSNVSRTLQEYSCTGRLVRWPREVSFCQSTAVHVARRPWSHSTCTWIASCQVCITQQ